MLLIIITCNVIFLFTCLLWIHSFYIHRSMTEKKITNLLHMSKIRSIIYCIVDKKKQQHGNIENKYKWHSSHSSHENLLLTTSRCWHFVFFPSCQSSFLRLDMGTSRSSAAAEQRSRCRSCRLLRKLSSRLSTQMSAWERGWLSASTCPKLAFRWGHATPKPWLQNLLKATLVLLTKNIEPAIMD